LLLCRLQMPLLDVTKAADLLRYRSQRRRQLMILRLQLLDQLCHQRFIVANELTLTLALGSIAKGIQGTAAQKAQADQHMERLEDPGSVLALAGPPGQRIAPGKQRRRQVHLESVLAFELGL